jgi:malate dehydrogenase (quinone)
MLKNLRLEIPVLRWGLFLRDARRIAPDLKYRDLGSAHPVDGIRSQLIDKGHRKLMMGGAKVDTGIGAIFSIAPSLHRHRGRG